MNDPRVAIFVLVLSIVGFLFLIYRILAKPRPKISRGQVLRHARQIKKLWPQISDEGLRGFLEAKFIEANPKNLLEEWGQLLISIADLDFEVKETIEEVIAMVQRPSPSINDPPA